MANTKATSQPILNFVGTTIKGIGFLFDGDSTAIVSKCTAKLSVETEVQKVQKKCGARVISSITKPTSVTVKVEGHLPVEVLRRVQGLKEYAELQPGVYAYGGGSTGETFALSAQLYDDFERVSQLKAFSKVASSTGLKFEIEDGADEVATFELEAEAYQDDLGFWYYEAFESEATSIDPQEWLTKFTLDTVKKTTSPAG